MRLRPFLPLSLFLLAAACGGSNDTTDSDDLTSLTARQRELSFEGVVYVPKNASDQAALDAVLEQTRSAFGALLHSEVAAQTRELTNVDKSSFKKRTVKVIDGESTTEMTEVRYTYRDKAIVPVAMSRKTSLALAVLGQGAANSTDKVVVACTLNDKEAREDAESGLLWYDFDPTRSSCKRAIESEQKAIDKATAELEDAKTTIPAARANRIYLPVTMQLGKADTAERATYPEYEKLFAGANEPGVLTLTVVAGRLAHEKVEARKDGGFFEWMSTLDVLFTDHPDFAFKKIEPEENLSTISAEGRKFDNLTFLDFINWTVRGRGFPEGMPPSSRDNIQKTVASKLDNHWVTFEKKVRVSIGGGEPKDLTIRLETLFGAEEDPAAHKRAIQRGDVFVYNGHSYIGEGPLDPANFTEKDFTRGYQLLWFDSCVSYNYYNKDFFTLKKNGSKDLDVITNGIEAPEADSGDAEGRFLSKLIDGSLPSYQTLLEAAKATDSLRVVEGEIDNTFDPKQTPIRFVK
jgi:hypothetical protein